MSPATFALIVSALGDQGRADIEWSEKAGPPDSPEDFASEAIFVICNSGMKNTVARRIYERVMRAIEGGTGSAHDAFGHKGKAAAIDTIWARRERLLADYMAAEDKVGFCASLPWIGGITKFHLAKNFGADVAKPDVHLQRLADHYGETVQGLCDRLAAESNYKSRTIHVLLWRACATGLIDSRSGEIRLPSATDAKS